MDVWETGDLEVVRREALRELGAARGGGFILQSDRLVSSAVSGHTHDYVVRLVREHGRYPLSIGEVEAPARNQSH